MERTVTVVPEEGLHARPAAVFVETANEYECDLQIGPPDEDPVDARSMLGVTSIGAKGGDNLVLYANGEDAAAALDALEDVLSTPEDEFDDE
ncbi:HPr family phosphocarrier protein [Halorhabdus rudnickae]|uniref:HPr family phosphocarrier protein n=1 Tax=Halorhabdus rudnickae TaxID=1775544 RepID=UPI001082F641|nr:HPr family phosphocarrier protein [Halorhabdus rudnickae]